MQVIKKSGKITAVFMFLVFAAFNSKSEESMKKIGQYVVTSIDTNKTNSHYILPDETIQAIFSEKLDSLVNSWYVNKLFLPRSNKPGDSYTYMPPISDSLLIARLKKIEGAVKLSYNAAVRDFIELYAAKKSNQVEIMLGLSSFYFPIFDEIFDRYQLPFELKYLSIIESALNPRAVSRAGAVGLWQFMFGTAKYLDLEVNTFVDERRDVLKSTEAAAKYLKQLYDIYGDWHMVIAAYNCGPGNVNKALKRTGGKDYWQIYYALPKETRGYVPAYIAATYVMNYYHEHQIEPRTPSFALVTDTLMLNKFFNLNQIAENLNLDINELRDLNPMYSRDVIPGTVEKMWPLRIPQENISTFIEQNSTIANRDREKYFPSNIIVNPQTSAVGSQIENSSGGTTKIFYTVKKGDNPGYIANWFNTSVSNVKKWNKMSGNLIRTGQKLAIFVPENQVDYYKKINNLSFSAKQKLGNHPVAVTKTENSVKVKPVEAAEETKTETIVAQNENAAKTSDSNEFVYYTVKNGDSLWTIAKKFPGISNKEIIQLNNIKDVKNLRAGQKLKIMPKT